jgi:hypothetical protein
LATLARLLLVSSAEVSTSELDTMAKIEHESWMKHLTKPWLALQAAAR